MHSSSSYRAPSHYVLGALVALTVLSASSCAVFDGSRRWAGTYGTLAESNMTLALLDSGQFKYEGHCFRGQSDARTWFQSSGHYSVVGNWIDLVPDTPGNDDSDSSCDRYKRFYRRFYAIEVDGNKLLISDQELSRFANNSHHGESLHDIYALRQNGKPVLLSSDPKTWLPQPYAGFATSAPITGTIIAVGEKKTRTLYGAAGRVDGEEGYAKVTINIGFRDGAFEGVRLCSPQQKYVWLINMDTEQSIVTWHWAIPYQTPPYVGMPVRSRCP